MKIRKANVLDARGICELVNDYAEQGLMLHRSLESVYTRIREFHVAVDEAGAVAGCVAVAIFWADLAEVKSLAVADSQRGRGLGRKLVEAALADAAGLGVRRLFALTYERGFFERLGFEVVDRQMLPEKVWTECLACPKAHCCDEIAMIYRAVPAGGEATGTGR